MAKELLLTVKIDDQNIFTKLEDMNTGKEFGTASIGIDKIPKNIPMSHLTYGTICSLKSLDENGIIDSLAWEEGYSGITVQTSEKVFHAYLVDIITNYDMPVEFLINKDI